MSPDPEADVDERTTLEAVTRAAMPDSNPSTPSPEALPSPESAQSPRRLSRREVLQLTAATSLAFGAGIGVGFWQWGLPLASATDPSAVGSAAPITSVPEPLALHADHRLPIAYGRIGPHLTNAGVLDYDAFVSVFDQEGALLSEAQRTLLREGSDARVVIDMANARFLLNLFWAVGLANNNPILRKGKMVTNGDGRIETYASTGGWTLNAQPIHAIYSASTLTTLTGPQQVRLEEAAAAIYRPCCNNATDFPDCNHGMAMLGILELMAAQDASVETMLETAKYVNRFWFPEQTRELALYYQAQGAEGFDAIPARDAVSVERFSASGFDAIHAWLAANGKGEAPGQGGSNCSV